MKCVRLERKEERRAVIQADDSRELPIAAMGPICIAPEFKRQGYGKILLDHTLGQARNFGIKAVCFEGNIDFYGKSGFDYASRFGVRYHGLPEDADASFWSLPQFSFWRRRSWACPPESVPLGIYPWR